jgi:hypothetical protein
MASQLNEVAVRSSENLDMLEGGSKGSGLVPGIIGLFDEYYFRQYRRETKADSRVQISP